MEHEHNPDLAKAIARLDRAMADLADIHGAVGLGLCQSLRTGLLNLEALDQFENPPQGLDRVIRYFEKRAPLGRSDKAFQID